MKKKRLKAMAALLKFLVLLASFHSGSYAHAFTSLSPVAGNQVRVNHLIRFQQPMSNPKNKPSREPTCEPTNDPMVNDQTTNQRLEWDAELPNILSPKRGKYSLSQKQDAELPSKIAISITQITSNTSYTFEAVNGVNHDHDKIKVDNRVTFENNRDDEIQCGSREQSKTHPSDWHGSKQQSFILSARVPFVTFRSNLSSGFDCWVHSHTGCEPVTSTRGLCHGKKSE
jgi:hypothetical protein